MTMAAMAPGPSEPAEDGGPRQPRARPPHPFLPPTPPPPGPPRPRGRTAALVQTLPRRAVLGAGRGGGRRRSGGRGLPRRAGALRRVFSRRQFGRLVPQGGLGLLRAFGCKAKDRCGAQEAGTAPPLLADRAGALCAGLRAVLALRFRGGGGAGWATEAEGPGVAPEPLPRPGGPPHRLPSASERTDCWGAKGSTGPLVKSCANFALVAELQGRGRENRAAEAAPCPQTPGLCRPGGGTRLRDPPHTPGSRRSAFTVEKVPGR